MKLIFNHTEGIFSKSGSCLLEVECYREQETAKYMFENGWLPFKEDKWYQCQSSRLLLSPISSRRKRELSKIKFSPTGDSINLIDRAKIFNCFNEEWLEFYSSLPNYTFYIDDAAMGIVNFYEDQIFYTSFVWDKNKKENSYGTLSYYHLVEKFRNDYEYMYISEFYEKFSYKQNLSGFEFWNGLEWKKEKKYL
jgi:hypothetical protein